MKKLPKRVSIDLSKLMCGDIVGDAINEYLSDKYGFCTNSWCYKITVFDIDWDTEGD